MVSLWLEADKSLKYLPINYEFLTMEVWRSNSLRLAWEFCRLVSAGHHTAAGISWDSPTSIAVKSREFEHWRILVKNICIADFQTCQMKLSFEGIARNFHQRNSKAPQLFITCAHVHRLNWNIPSSLVYDLTTTSSKMNQAWATDVKILCW